MGNIILSVDNYIATVTIDRPPVNATTMALYNEIKETFYEINHRDDIRAVIFTGAGEKAFCAGNDLYDFKDINEGMMNKEELEDRAKLVRESFWSVYDCRVPVIGAINGPALGTGVAYAAVCDLLVCSEKAVFGLPEILIGVMGGAKHLSRLLPQSLVRYMHYTGERVDGHTLKEYGSVFDVVSQDKLLDTANKLAQKMINKSPLAMRLAKESLNRLETMDLKEGYALEQEMTAELRETEDSKEALSAYLEKREPVFKLK